MPVAKCRGLEGCYEKATGIVASPSFMSALSAQIQADPSRIQYGRTSRNSPSV